MKVYKNPKVQVIWLFSLCEMYLLKRKMHLKSYTPDPDVKFILVRNLHSWATYNCNSGYQQSCV